MQDASNSEGTGRSGSNDSATDRSLEHSLKDAAAYATMFGVGESYLSAFAIFLKASTPQIGLLVSLPNLLASFVQLFSAWLGKRTGKRKAIILAGASLQATTWLPIALLPLLFPDLAVYLLILTVVLYQFGAHLAAPQWGSMMGDIVPERRRGRFFALRTKVVSLLTILSLAIGGGVLHQFDGVGFTLAGFMVIFGVAMLARWVSIYHLAKMHDPPGHVAALEVPFDKSWLQRLRQSQFARFSMFFALTQFSVAIASPFFSVYVLRDLDYSYGRFMIYSSASVLTQVLTLSQWGRISDVFGNRRVLSVTGVLLPVMPLLWLMSTDFWYLLCVQALSGFAWAGFTLSASNFIYDLTAREKRATYLAIHNILAAIGIFCGALFGGYLGLVLPAQLEIFGLTWAWVSPLLGVFALSAIARVLVLLVLLPKIREVRRVRPISFTDVIFRVTRVSALAGLMFDIVGAKPKSTRDKDGEARE